MFSLAAQSDTLKKMARQFLFFSSLLTTKETAKMLRAPKVLDHLVYSKTNYTLIEIRAPNVVRYAKLGIRQLRIEG